MEKEKIAECSWYPTPHPLEDEGVTKICREAKQFCCTWSNSKEGLDVPMPVVDWTRDQTPCRRNKEREKRQ